MAQGGRLERMGMRPIYNLKPVQDSTLSALKSLKNSLNEALRKGKKYRETSKKKWGGSEHPMNQ